MGFSIFGSEDNHVLSSNINSFGFPLFELLRMKCDVPPVRIRRQRLTNFLFFSIISRFDEKLGLPEFAVISDVKDYRNKSYSKSSVRHRKA